MTIQDLVQRCELQVLTGSALLDRTVRGCYIGDLLSWAMGKVRVDNAWLTVMGNVNAVAVAVLADAACIVLVDNATLDPEAEKKIPYMNSDYSEYLVKVIGDDFSTDRWKWITGLTGIHKLTYKLSNSINRNNSFYRYILENKE